MSSWSPPTPAFTCAVCRREVPRGLAIHGCRNAAVALTLSGLVVSLHATTDRAWQALKRAQAKLDRRRGAGGDEALPDFTNQKSMP